MRPARFSTLFMILSGLALVSFGIVLLLADTRIQAQDDSAPARYIGASECRSCHRDLYRDHQNSVHARTLQNVERDKKLVLGDFNSGEALREITFPEENEPRAFTADDIALAVGTGRYTQAYLYRIERNRYVLFPARWNTAAQSWEAYGNAANWPNDEIFDWAKNCAGCHTTGLDVERERWKDEGVQCEACHGPGSSHTDAVDEAGRSPDAEELQAIRTSITASPDAQICGQCHSRGAEPVANHSFPINYRPGGSLVADDIFTLAAPDDPLYWWPSGHARLPNMQFNEWFASAHAKPPSTLQDAANAEDGCLQCHSADYRQTEQIRARHAAGEREGETPAALTLKTAQMGITCLTCHNPHSKTNLEFNLVAEPYTLCVSCHSNASFTAAGFTGIHHPAQEMFEGIQIIPQVRGRASDHFLNEDGPTCQTCHAYETPVESSTRASHALGPVLPGQVLNLEGIIDTCTVCHEDEVDAVTMQRLIDDIQTNTRARIETARAAVNAGTQTWVIQALDFVEGDGSAGIHNYAYTDRLLDAVFTELGLFTRMGE